MVLEWAVWLYGTFAEHDITYSFFKKMNTVHNFVHSDNNYDSSVNCLQKLSFADIWDYHCRLEKKMHRLSLELRWLFNWHSQSAKEQILQSVFKIK